MMLDTVVQDVRYGARMLRRSPMFTAVAVCAIGIAMGVNVGVFTLIDALAWRPLPVPDPSSLVMLHPVDAHGARQNLFSYPELAELRAAMRTLSGVGAYGFRPVTLAPVSGGASTGGELGLAEPALVTAAFVSGDFFALLGTHAVIGRGLLPDDERSGAPRVVVLGERFWESRFARSRDVLGREVVLNGVLATVVGVAPRDFTGAEPRTPDAWLPVTLAGAMGVTPEPLDARTNRWLVLHGRLRPGVRESQAEAELSTIVRRMAGTRTSPGDPIAISLTPQSSLLPLGPTERALLAPAILPVILVLVIACANLATLLVARALTRQREIATRLALGASRLRIVRQLMTESLFIATLGGALGLVISDWGLRTLARSVVALLPPFAGTIVLDLHPSTRVVAYAALLVLLSTLSFGLVPALQATAPDLTAHLKGEDRTFGTRVRRSRFRNWLVAAQVAACAVLLVAAGILVGSVRRMLDARTGVEPTRVAVAQFGLGAQGHIAPARAAARAAYAKRVAAVPGVAGVARVLQVPFTGSSMHVPIRLDTRDAAVRYLRANVVSASYFDVVGDRILSGRTFTDAESGADAHLAVLSEGAARTLWPGRSAIGQLLRVTKPGAASDEPYEVIGVVANARTGWLWEKDDAYVFLPAAPADLAASDMPLLVRTSRPFPGLEPALRQLARDVDRGIPLIVRPLTDVLREQLLPFDYTAKIATGVGVFGLLLAALGLYGVIAFAVQQRTREIAVHVALGAGSRDVLRLVLRREMGLVLTGIVVGLVLSLGEAGLLSHSLVPLEPMGPVGFAGVSLFLFAVAGAAVLVPAFRALRIEPMQVLRYE